MSSIIVAMPKVDDAKKIANILRARGMSRVETCTTGAAILSRVHQLDYGVVICTKSIKDMHCNELVTSLPDYFELLLLASREGLEYCPPNVVTVAMPFKVSDLVSSVEMILGQLEHRIRRDKRKPKIRSKEEQDCINKAKMLLMERNNMTEQEAFRYIQKSSMDSGTNMLEMAQMILLLQSE
ncbi:MAG: ANTAR domain-containing protein [Lachnospiraceae bacterium]|nr:ANTAR domain-containing protein [Lachnospiraceae bacterium]